ncbi:29581_t:CDS:2, partial [Racocetra persica]
ERTQAVVTVFQYPNVPWITVIIVIVDKDVIRLKCSERPHIGQTTDKHL